MESLNSTTEVVEVRHILEAHNLYSEVFRILTYGVAGLVILINGTIATAFLIQKCRRPTTVHLSPAGIVVLNLLMADTLVGTVVTINIATYSPDVVLYKYWCCARLGVTFLVMVGSHIALINVAIDRLVAISCNLHYREWMTIPRSIFMVVFGWLVLIPVAIAAIVIASKGWHPGLARCTDIHDVRLFIYYVFIPSHIVAIGCVIVIQSRMYLYLRRQEKKASSSTSIHNFRRFSNKSAKILFRVTTTFVLCWGPFDVMIIITVLRVNMVIKTVYDLTRIFALVPFLVNPLVYSYQTGNIRKPVTDLFTDIRKRWLPAARVSTAGSPSATGQLQDISIIGTGTWLRKSSSVSSVFTQSTSTT